MVGRRPAVVLFLFGICAVNANVLLPRKHILDIATFEAEVPSVGYYPWKSMWEFSTDNSSTVDTKFGAEFRFALNAEKDLSALVNIYDLNTDSCQNSALYSGVQQSTDSIFLPDPGSKLYFFSSDPTKYLWMYECSWFDVEDCLEDYLRIRLLFNQGSTFDRPEGLPWARILKDLKQATKLTLDEVKIGGFGTFRAAYVYKDYSDVSCDD